MKGIILASSLGTSLYPITQAIPKHLLPIYDKPMIYYPLATLMLAGIRDILIITAPEDKGNFQQVLLDGSQWGITLQYAVQPSPGGVAQALIVGADHIAGSRCALILGDNIFHGRGLSVLLRKVINDPRAATVFAYQVSNPERYRVVEFDRHMRAINIEEKPLRPRSNWAVTGLYFYDEHASDLAAALRLSAHGELEIGDLNRVYLERGGLSVERMGHDYAWLDTGTPDSLMVASGFVATIERRQGLKVACPEEIAYRMGYIGRLDLQACIDRHSRSSYGRYLQGLLESAAEETYNSIMHERFRWRTGEWLAHAL
jgi:glucose-1-phosphate thymidylyltransferase